MAVSIIREAIIIVHSNLLPGERVEDLERKGRVIIQDPKRFCFGSDAILLSHFVKANPKDRMLDIGTGTGIIPIMCEALLDIENIKALEIQEESADMARRSVALNNLEDRIEVVTGDVKEAIDIFGRESFDIITTNPPYMIGGHGMVNPKDAKAVARHEISCTLEDIMYQAERLLKTSGRFYMVHRPFRLPEIMSTMCKYHIEPKTMRLVYPLADKEPTMVLIEGVKGGKPRLNTMPPLIINKDDGSFTEEVARMYGEI